MTLKPGEKLALKLAKFLKFLSEIEEMITIGSINLDPHGHDDKKVIITFMFSK